MRWPVGASWACIRGFPLRARLGIAAAPFPASATSHVACGFPALRAPTHFASRFMRPINLERLLRTTARTIRGTRKRVPTCCTAIPCSIASSRSLGAGTPEPNDAESSSLPSFGYPHFPAFAVIRGTLLPRLSRWDEDGFSSCSACPCHRAAPTTPPK